MSTATKVKVVSIEFSWDCPQYYTPPFGRDCYVGVGYTPTEAAEDCVASIYAAGYSISGADERAVFIQAEECPPADECDDEDPCVDGPYWYCAVQID